MKNLVIQKYNENKITLQGKILPQEQWRQQWQRLVFVPVDRRRQTLDHLCQYTIFEQQMQSQRLQNPTFGCIISVSLIHGKEVHFADRHI